MHGFIIYICLLMSLTALYNYMGTRRNTCFYRFDQMLQTRTKNFANPKASPSQLQKSKQQILNASNTYINCLRNQYEERLPEQYQPMINQFNQMLYTELQPAHRLEDYTLKILRAFYQGKAN